MMVPGEDRRSAVRIPRILARTAVFSVLCLCACAAQPPSASLEPVPAASSAESGLFSEIYQSVIEYHVEATRADTLSLAALDDLSSLDPSWRSAATPTTWCCAMAAGSGVFVPPPPSIPTIGAS